MEKQFKYPKSAGIYKLTCNENGKIYIGKGINIRARLSNHKNISKRLTGVCYFQNALIKYGWESFRVEILEILENFDKNEEKDKLHIIEREAYFIELFDSTNKNVGYNVCKRSIDRTGMSHSEESRRKMSESRRGVLKTEKTKEKIRQARMGKKHSIETRKKISERNLGRVHTEEQKEKNRQAKKGTIISEETREKLRLRKNNLGNKHSMETKEKIRQARLGKPSNRWLNYMPDKNVENISPIEEI